jgi:hypothetical protein
MRPGFKTQTCAFHVFQPKRLTRQAPLLSLRCCLIAGRASHHSFRDDGSPPVAPSAIAISGHTHDKVRLTSHCTIKPINL